MPISLAEAIACHTREGELYQKLSDERLNCFACGHRCRIPEGRAGICKVRFNKAGKLYVPWGYVAGLQDDPIEKKPFFHVVPGARTLSFGMLGCDFHCAYCQNWETSQTMRDPAAGASVQPIQPEEIVKLALARRCQVVVSTYNEPLITSEWAVEIFKEAKRSGLRTAYVSNGNGTPEVLDYLRPHLDFIKVDLKSFNEAHYRGLGGNLETILETIRGIWARKFWMEIVTLLIPGFNDSEEELKKLTGFIASASPDIPWHVTAFHPDYKMTGSQNTSAADLLRAAAFGKAAGLRYIYAGNLPGQVGGGENTVCPGCGEVLIERSGFQILKNKISDGKGACPQCRISITGVWE